MNISFEGQVALVTGAAAGMGLSAVYAFVRAGAAVVVADIDGNKVQEIADELNAAGHKAIGVVCDVADENQVRAMVDKAVSEFGGLHMAFNNAGIQSPRKDTAEVTTEEWDRVMAVNLRGVYFCMKYELLQMEKQGKGAIVNNSSIGGIIAVSGRAPYVATKHAVLGLTKTAAVEYAAKGIRINAICPGTIKTPMVERMLQTGDLSEAEINRSIPANRLGESEDISDALIWLCSPMSSYVIGQAITVDGGCTIL